MILKYNNFIKINENVDKWVLLSNELNKFMADVDDKLKEPLKGLISKLRNVDNKKQVISFTKDYYNLIINNYKKDIENINSLKELKLFIIDILTIIYSSITSQKEYFGEDVFSNEIIFKNSSESIKKLFISDFKFFNKSVEPFSIDLLTTLSPKFGYNKDSVYKELTNPNYLKDDEQTKQINNALGEEQAEVNNKTDLNGLKQLILNWLDLEIYKKIHTTLIGIKLDDQKV